MRKGKKVLARSLIEQTFETIKRIQIERYHKETPEARREIILDPTTILHKALINVEPVMELMGIKKGGTTYQVNKLITYVII